MLLRRLKLVNYAGIYNGMGLYQIEIDFTKCIHRLILIKGDNGTGKSTIENALKPLPDDNSAFIVGKSAVKEIDYYDEMTGIIYEIKFLHEWKKNSRTTKGYFTKVINGVSTELNPSGNINGCKDIIYDELQLSPNYIMLTQLSSTSRGIADMRPSDRKRYVNSIMSNIDVYNNMYKQLSKQSSNYKAMMNAIVSKLDSIGNSGMLQQNLDVCNTSLAQMEQNINSYIDTRSKEQGVLQIMAPDKSIIDRLGTLENDLMQLILNRDETQKKLDKIYTNYPSLKNTVIREHELDIMRNNITELNVEMSSIKSKIGLLLETRQSDAAELQIKAAKLASIHNDDNIEEVAKIKKELCYKKEAIERRWGDIISINDISKEEFSFAYDTLHTIQEMSHNVKIYDASVLDLTINHANKQLSELNKQINTETNNLIQLEAVKDKIKILKQRPTTCTNDKCPFIEDALLAKETFIELQRHIGNLDMLNNQKAEIESLLVELEKNVNIRTVYESGKYVIDKLNIGIHSYDDCINTIRSEYLDSILDMIYGLIGYIEDIECYHNIEKNISDIESKYNSLSSQQELIDMIRGDIDKINIQLDSDSKEIEQANQRYNELRDKCDGIKDLYEICSEVVEIITTLDVDNDKIDAMQQEISNNKSDIDNIKRLNRDIEQLTKAIEHTKQQMEPIKRSKSELEYKLAMYNEYSNQLNEYKNMYDKIETLKYYSSPTTGIQITFINMYLGNIINKANNILMNLFHGRFELLPLVINETEFKIPVAVNGGINHDDITSMSSAQIALISMIISIAMLSQTSTKLNIIVGDEIDSPFDAENRRGFIDILYQLMGLVNSSQCVLVSHNSEIPIENCDVILLRSDNDIISSGNIIWRYK